ncbi:hypothetical protein C8R47DRAFT_967002, partial [Mycena vitilis]
PRPAVAGCLYLVGFAQVGAPHAAIILAQSAEAGRMVHISVASGVWKYQARNQKIQGSMSLTSLIKIRDVSKGSLTQEALEHNRCR